MKRKTKKGGMYFIRYDSEQEAVMVEYLARDFITIPLLVVDLKGRRTIWYSRAAMDSIKSIKRAAKAVLGLRGNSDFPLQTQRETLKLITTVRKIPETRG